MGITRRTFLKGAGAAAGAGALGARAADARSAPAHPDDAALDGEDLVDVEVVLNGAPLTLRVTAGAPLAHAVRAAGLSGTKLSCEAGVCGACTLLVDGRARYGCVTLALEVAGAHITTIEGLAADDELHPVQQAILEADALQCGFCTPGFAVSSAAFHDAFARAKRSGRPRDDEVAHALAGNLCRCGCQPGLKEALAAACAGESARSVGGRVPGEERALLRVDGKDKVTGRARYSFDVERPHMLHGAVVRSRVAVGVIRRIDASAALAMPGVAAVDLSMIARSGGYGKLRYVGQPIALVAADSEDLARAAARAVIVEVDEGPFVVDPAAAARDGAPLVWSESERGRAPNSAEGPKEPEAVHAWHGNVRGGLIAFGDDDSGARAVDAAPVRVELDAATAAQHHATLERLGGVAHFDGDALTLWCAGQAVQMMAPDLAGRVGLPSSKVRVISENVGGAFGSKALLKPEYVAAAHLSLKTKRPVRVFVPLHDHMVIGGYRAGTRHRMRVGATHEGALLGVHHDGTASTGVAVGERTGWATHDHYRWPAHTIVEHNVVTNAPPALPFRAPAGAPPNAFVLEQAVDDVARAAGVHPVALRLRNDDDERRRRIYALALDRMPPLGKKGESEDGRFVRGVGAATAQWWVLASPSCKVELRAHKSGDVEASSAVHDLGQGARTVLASVVADELDLDADKIHVKVGDSALVSGTGAFGSITTASVGYAAAQACRALKAKLVRAARTVHPECAETPGGVVVGRKRLRWRELFALLPEDPCVVLGLRGDDVDGYQVPPMKVGALAQVLPAAITKDLVTSVQVADLTVDKLLGRVQVHKIVVVMDAGRILSPRTAKTNVMGGVIQGMSRALYEEMKLDPRTGHVMSYGFETYSILGVADAPEIEIVFADVHRTHNPYGALGLSEHCTIATCGAIANAFRAATGKRALSTPISPRRVLEMLS